KNSAPSRSHTTGAAPLVTTIASSSQSPSRSAVISAAGARGGPPVAAPTDSLLPFAESTAALSGATASTTAPPCPYDAASSAPDGPAAAPTRATEPPRPTWHFGSAIVTSSVKLSAADAT